MVACKAEVYTVDTYVHSFINFTCRVIIRCI